MAFSLTRALAWMLAPLALALGVAPALSTLPSSNERLNKALDGAFGDWFTTGSAAYAADPASSDDVVQQSLKRRPLDAGMIRLMARGKLVSSANTLRLAHRVSRRDLETQISMITVALSEKRYADLVQHADQALMANATAEGIIIPWMVQNIRLLGGAQSLSKYAQRPWFASFAKSGLRHPELAQDFTRLIIVTRPLRRDERYEDLGAALLRAYVGVDQIPLVKKYIMETVGAGQASVSPSGFSSFNAADAKSLGPYAWQFQNSADAYVEIGGSGALELFVSPGRRVKIAEITTLFAPGAYVLSQQLTSDARNGGATVQWLLACQGASGDRTIWSGELSREKIQDQRVEFSLPAENCERQRWSLLGIGADIQGQSSAALKSLSLSRLSGR